MRQNPEGLPALLLSHAKETPFWGWALLALYLAGLAYYFGHGSYEQYQREIQLRDHGIKLVSTVTGKTDGGKHYYIDYLFHFGAPGDMWRGNDEVYAGEFERLNEGSRLYVLVDPKAPANNKIFTGSERDANYALDEIESFSLGFFGLGALGVGVWWVGTMSAAELLKANKRHRPA